MHRCIVLEDEELTAKAMEKLISMVDSLDFKGHYSNPVEALNSVDFSEIDLIFLDVEMPEISGLDFIKSIANPPKVIVTTSKKDFAIGAFEIDAVDFILKPATMPKVLKALQKLESTEKTSTNDDAIFIKVDSKLVNVKFSELAWIEALGDYVGFHVNDKRYVVKSTLSAIEKKLNSQKFIRVHRSFIVNVAFIKDIDDSSLVIGDKLIPVSRGNRPDLIKRLNRL